ncbi:hypothetical protein MLD38_016104 [Melastoma candidum]|uniref:Uncharacterized protein n=1 Tax=Melastoma candidum TaxID=119954 RepID=A0ACB9RJH4_9MYRT|nr:hypothetical protein MLD38_016104 [Melastoma candidum]
MIEAEKRRKLLPAKTAKGKAFASPPPPHRRFPPQFTPIPFILIPQVNGNASTKNPTAVNLDVGKLLLGYVAAFEWKQQFGNETEPKPNSSSKEDIGQRERSREGKDYSITGEKYPEAPRAY